MTTESAVLKWVGWASPAKEADWDALFHEQLPRVYNYFRYRLGSAQEAEDLTSVTFEKAWRARGRYRRDLASFATWLFTIARNVAADHYRRQRPHAPLEAAAGIAGGRTPEEEMVERSELDQLRRLVETLPERDRHLLALKYGAELTNRAIARQTGLSESNVGTLLHRTIQALRADWKEEES
jgi:RNA polymerase sigma-70 factor (ECF subfamily)